MNVAARPDPFAPSQPEVDVCIVVEGCYPFVAGGVSSWLDWLMRSLPDVTFGVVAITADSKPRKPVYPTPPNVGFLQVLPLTPPIHKPGLSQPSVDADGLIDVMFRVLRNGDIQAFHDLLSMTTTPVPRSPFGWVRPAAAPSYSELLGSQLAWQAMTGTYERLCPEASFSDFFWAWRSLVGGMFALLKAPVPPARSYHAISTGYAGLYTARAALQTGRPAAITEHGIYTNERRIDLIMADWINDTVKTELAAVDARSDVRDFWIQSFESYSRIAYAAASEITTLYGENQTMQRALGAAPSKLRVIPNGIDLTKFDALPPRDRGQRPTVALIGRVVPIKDIQAFIVASAIIRRAVPHVEILIIGPMDEDAAYYEACVRAVDELGLTETVQFTGRVNIFDYMSRIDVLVLTSISEAQPLVLLEAGAARIACVATDVGSCREIIEGMPDELPKLGAGGRVVPAMDTDAIGEAVVELLRDKDLRAACGEALRQRVATHFSSARSAAQYLDLYADLLAT
jgi:polysaccharide biosynthesis protein PelF